jgi:TRAP-type C4-dicarboxylate transport system substrate-binding protein
LWNMGTTRSAGLEKAYRYSVEGPQIGSGTTLYGMNQKIWDKLPADVQAAIMKAAASTQQHLCKFLDAQNDSELEWLVKEAKFTHTKLSAEELARWNERLAPVGADWAKDMDSTGRPGTAILKAFRDAPSK